MKPSGFNSSVLKRLELRSSKLVSGDLLGTYRSAFRGSGVEYADLREYAPGDDIKHIHWKATARSNSVYVKSYQEERQLRVVLAVDTSASMTLPSDGLVWSKATEFCALLGALTLKANDLFGLLTFSGSVDSFYPPKSGVKAYSKSIASILNSEKSSSSQTDLNSALNYLLERLMKPCIVFIVSDFATGLQNLNLQRVAARHDLILAQLKSPPPPDSSLGIVRFYDPESGGMFRIDTSSKHSRTAWLSALNQHEQGISEAARNAGAAHLSISNDIVQPLLHLMKSRTQRRTR